HRASPSRASARDRSAPSATYRSANLARRRWVTAPAKPMSTSGVSSVLSLSATSAWSNPQAKWCSRVCRSSAPSFLETTNRRYMPARHPSARGRDAVYARPGTRASDGCRRGRAPTGGAERARDPRRRGRSRPGGRRNQPRRFDAGALRAGGFFGAGGLRAADGGSVATARFFADGALAGLAPGLADTATGAFVRAVAWRVVGASADSTSRAFLPAAAPGRAPPRLAFSSTSATASSSVIASARSRSGIVAFVSPCFTYGP